MIQSSHENSGFKEKKFPIILVLDSITSPANIGSLFRLADAFNIEKIIFCGTESPDLNSNRLKRTARSTINSVAHEHQEDILAACNELSENGYELFALEIAEGSEAIDSVNFGDHKKVALVLGNENTGISEGVLKKVNKSLHINMFGKNSSMNVAQAAGIALFEITKSLQPV